MGYTEALRPLRQVIEKAVVDTSEKGLHSLPVGAVPILAAAAEVLQTVMQGEGRWESPE